MFPVALWIAHAEQTLHVREARGPMFCRDEATAVKVGRTFFLSFYNAQDIPELLVTAKKKGDFWILSFGGSNNEGSPMIEPRWMAIDRVQGGVRAFSFRSEKQLLLLLAKFGNETRWKR